MKYQIKNRFTGEVQYEADISCDEECSHGVKTGLLVIDAYLRGADLRYADLRDANLRDADFSDEDFRYADFSNADLRYADLRGADLRYADLSYANLRYANLRYANLSNADLSNADLGGAPKIKGIHKKVFESCSVDGALNMSNWHSCETTHCRAGWVTTLAGYEGSILEKDIGTSAAAALIYIASDPDLEGIPDFYCSNSEALEDMERLAKKEALQ